MKKLLLIPILISISIGLAAQTSKYDRVGMTVINTNYNDEFTTNINKYFESMGVDSRYDVNKVANTVMNVDGSRLKFKTVQGERVYEVPLITEKVTQFLENNKIGLQIVSTIFNRQPDGKMDLSLLHYRGQYNATDEEYFQSVASKRGAESLKEAGEKLIDNSFIVVYDLVNTRYEFIKDKEGGGDYHFKGHFVAYLYKITWSEELLYKIWDCWVDDETPEGEKAAKNSAYNSLIIPLEQVTQVKSAEIDVDTQIEASKKNPIMAGINKLRTPEQLKEAAWEKFMNKGINDCFQELEKKNEKLTLKTVIHGTKPIRAKIGTKEGVKKDYAFFVYENVLGNNNEIQQKRVGVIRATKEIADNKRITTGDFTPSVFYQYAGGKVEEGQTLIEKKLVKAALQLGYGVGGYSALQFGLEIDSYSGTNTQTFLGLNGSYGGGGFNIGAIAGYGFRTNNFHIFPLVGAYYDALTGNDFSEDDQKENNAIFGRVGIKSNINLSFPFQVYVEAGYNFLFSEGATYAAYKGARTVEGVTVGFGIRYCF